MLPINVSGNLDVGVCSLLSPLSGFQLIICTRRTKFRLSDRKSNNPGSES